MELILENEGYNIQIDDSVKKLITKKVLIKTLEQDH